MRKKAWIYYKNRERGCVLKSEREREIQRVTERGRDRESGRDRLRQSDSERDSYFPRRGTGEKGALCAARPAGGGKALVVSDKLAPDLLLVSPPSPTVPPPRHWYGQQNTI